jgi:hypothetical protein
MLKLNNLSLMLSLALLASSPALAASQNFKALKYALGSRNSEPRMYLPSAVVLGNEVEIAVLAPGAKSVKLLKSDTEGMINYEGQKLRLGEQYEVLGESFADRAEFKVSIDPEAYKDLVSKNIFFEALAYYEDERTGELFARPVAFYGPNASSSVTNGVQILSKPQEGSSSLAASAKAFMPGFQQTGF